MGAKAKIIADNMNMDIAEADRMKSGVAAVKEAFEACYTSMGITCGHVGGLILQDAEYYDGMAPCNDADLPAAPAAAAAEAEGTASSSVQAVMALSLWALVLVQVALS